MEASSITETPSEEVTGCIASELQIALPQF